jgi:hypothetical protein
MSAVTGAMVAGVVGVLLALGAALGLVAVQSATPPVVSTPYVTYDS